MVNMTSKFLGSYEVLYPAAEIPISHNKIKTANQHGIKKRKKVFLVFLWQHLQIYSKRLQIQVFNNRSFLVYDAT